MNASITYWRKLLGDLAYLRGRDAAGLDHHQEEDDQKDQQLQLTNIFHRPSGPSCSSLAGLPDVTRS